MRCSINRAFLSLQPRFSAATLVRDWISKYFPCIGTITTFHLESSHGLHLDGEVDQTAFTLCIALFRWGTCSATLVRRNSSLPPFQPWWPPTSPSGFWRNCAWRGCRAGSDHLTISWWTVGIKLTDPNYTTRQWDACMDTKCEQNHDLQDRGGCSCARDRMLLDEAEYRLFISNNCTLVTLVACLPDSITIFVSLILTLPVLCVLCRRIVINQLLPPVDEENSVIPKEAMQVTWTSEEHTCSFINSRWLGGRYKQCQIHALQCCSACPISSNSGFGWIWCCNSNWAIWTLSMAHICRPMPGVCSSNHWYLTPAKVLCLICWHSWFTHNL